MSLHTKTSHSFIHTKIRVTLPNILDNFTLGFLLNRNIYIYPSKYTHKNDKSPIICKNLKSETSKMFIKNRIYKEVVI